jgi:hypothetical protein
MWYREEEEERWPYWSAGLLNSDFEQFLVQSLAAQLQVHTSETWWVTCLISSFTKMREVIAKVTVESTSKSYIFLVPCDRLCRRVLDLVIIFWCHFWGELSHSFWKF